MTDEQRDITHADEVAGLGWRLVRAQFDGHGVEVPADLLPEVAGWLAGLSRQLLAAHAQRNGTEPEALLDRLEAQSIARMLTGARR